MNPNDSLLYSQIVIREASPNSWWKQMQRPITKHQAEIRESCGSGGGRIKRAREAKDIIREARKSTNLASQRLNHQQSTCMKVKSALCTCVTVVFCLLWDPCSQIRGCLWLCFWDHFLLLSCLVQPELDLPWLVDMHESLLLGGGVLEEERE